MDGEQPETGRWGGRIGAHLEDFDADSRAVLQQLRGDGDLWHRVDDVVRSRPALALGIAFSLGLLLSAWSRR